MPPKGKAKAAASKAGAKTGAKAKAKSAKAGAAPVPVHAQEVGPPPTPEELEWCERFQGLPLMSCAIDEFPVPPTLNSVQVRIWKRMWEQGQEILKGGRSDAADDAMRKVLQRTRERAADADPDTLRVVEHVHVWLRWFDQSAAAAISFMDDIGGDDEEGEDG
mmetsp:Transcript_53725/g.156620  ORF Transcript_53725/g.156620 Transcript_53725/m.156620 type:complete len:163 (-) Transcript_53725:292-780(-)